MAELSIRVTPRSSQSKVAIQPDGTLKVWVNAPPVEGAANTAVCEILAKQLKVPKGRIMIVAGDTSRTKLVRIQGLSTEEILEKLAAGA